MKMEEKRPPAPHSRVGDPNVAHAWTRAAELIGPMVDGQVEVGRDARPKDFGDAGRTTQQQPNRGTDAGKTGDPTILQLKPKRR
ncbi:hypothetical protein [uncultured Sphingomonas sp.]|uniref:hypothetical protein n=1 Tax=uncultured Sphingomonas sp. TaxID=158754 RepID=UPI0025F2F8C6|nr:hypothetical protein [uncultured Sphingomonas sp.]